ncbi:hypothetical protein CHLRE_08g380300v5 [Chlamydomonas reinhardtii]|uniref:peptide-methionine (S)-S-oxide reductase n=1 Tax=Chlamydomonas reinhardtii TaxID=3055 RepID=A0A2K3DI00_CHLRE|nr:uncharacterized protein CHLRE_08g380300v5 [Chlamydomonas reinhardtii]PNW80156.1 hypothetical protein CHLRE_08g380300v5 [Chlamydomonas reinhardtii]
MGFFNFGSLFSKEQCKLAPAQAPEGLKLATFAGGCFWGIELAYQRVPGVVATTVGYTGGADKNPNYDSVCSGRSGHAEAIQCTYDPKQCSYDSLLDTFFARVDPTTLNRQGNDRGTQYRSAIYYHDEQQRAAAAARIAAANNAIAEGKAPSRWAGSRVVAQLEPAGDYYIAEDYHQQYLSKGGRFGQAQSAAKGCNDPIRCYG